jgi:Ca-activated chloride channel family protein
MKSIPVSAQIVYKVKMNTLRKKLMPLLLPMVFGLSFCPRAGTSALQNDSEVFVTVTVSDKSGRCATSLTGDDFVVSDGKAVEITSFEAAGPTSIGIALDVSSSVLGRNKSQMTFITEMLSYLVEGSGQSGQHFVYIFGGTPELLSDWARGANVVAEKLGNIDFSRKRQGSALYDTCYAAIDKLRRGAPTRRVLIVVSDGEDSSSERKAGELRKILKESDVVVYSIGLINTLDDPLAVFNREIFEEFESISAGDSFFPTSLVEVNQAFETIVSEMRCQYRIGFKPSFRDGKWHSIKVKLSGEAKKNFSVRSRDEYFAQAGAR